MPRTCNNNLEMGEIFKNLEDSYQVIVQTDKTNIFRSVKTKKYMTTVNEH